ncbi:MAG TPA: hypothetical protein VFW21_00640 [Mycobacterium sp.]|nr:hypothetical protein [Mycobacterium sp.]
MNRRDVVLIAGPELAGTSGVAVALRGRLAYLQVVEVADMAPDLAPAAVVFVVSAAARLTASDCALLDTVAARTDVVLGVVSKIDVHSDWRATLATNRATATAHDGRYVQMPWVGVAAAPPIGVGRLDELVALLCRLLACPLLESRNQLRSKEFGINLAIGRLERGHQVAGTKRQERLAQLRARRAQLAGGHRRAHADRTAELRGRLRQARVEMSYLVGDRIAAGRVDLQDRAAGLTHRGVAGFEAVVAARVTALAAGIAEEADRYMEAIGCDLGLADPAAVSVHPPDIGSVPTATRRPEASLTALLGAGFAIGVAVSLRRLLAGVAPGPAATVVCVIVGAGLTCWIAAARRLLGQRAAYLRWAADVLGRARLALERDVAAGLLVTENTWHAALTQAADTAVARGVEQLAAVDTEAAALAREHRRAAVERERTLPVLQRDLVDVRDQLERLRQAAEGI